MNGTSLKKALYAGVAGTVVMTVFSYLSSYLSLPGTDYHGMIASRFHTEGFFTWVVYFGFGVALAYLYGVFKTRLPASSWHRGIFYALVLWGFMEVILMPVIGKGFFSGSIAAAVTAMIGMGLYGATVGYLHDH